MSGFSFYTPETELDLSWEYRSYVPAFYGKHLTYSIVYAYRMLCTTLTFMNLVSGVMTMTWVNCVPQNSFIALIVCGRYQFQMTYSDTTTTSTI